MTADSAVALIMTMLKATLFVTGPILIVALLAGVIVGIAQTATQVNEASISYVVKVGAVIGVLVVLGPTLMAHMVTYTKSCFTSIETVVH